jgi:oxygen-independent coproporphyrinogen-3 oxidase
MIKSLYIHIPFCRNKCSYCDFVSFARNSQDYDRYVDVLIEELKFKKNEYSLSSLNTIYIGGGTPTVLPLSSLKKLFEYVKESFVFSQNYEYTIEGNPESIDIEKLKLMRSFGINRISMGVQSFNEEILKFLGRVHDKNQVVKAFNLAREAGFENISIDLIYGIPGENIESWKETLKTAVALSPEHISLYQLKIEEDTPLCSKLNKGEISLFPDDLAEKIYNWNNSYLSENLYINYEFSNFAKNNLYSKHNLNYWNYLPYAAAGFGGIGFYGNYRSGFLDNYNSYINKDDFSKADFYEELLSKEEKTSEYIIMNLRKTEGFLLEDFHQRFNVSFLEIYGKQVEKLERENFLKVSGHKVSLTMQGRLISNLVLEEFV